MASVLGDPANLPGARRRVLSDCPLLVMPSVITCSRREPPGFSIVKVSLSPFAVSQWFESIRSGTVEISFSKETSSYGFSNH